MRRKRHGVSRKPVWAVPDTYVRVAQRDLAVAGSNLGIAQPDLGWPGSDLDPSRNYLGVAQRPVGVL
jgi:hypothetical protein